MNKIHINLKKVYITKRVKLFASLVQINIPIQCNIIGKKKHLE